MRHQELASARMTWLGAPREDDWLPPTNFIDVQRELGFLR